MSKASSKGLRPIKVVQPDKSKCFLFNLCCKPKMNSKLMEELENDSTNLMMGSTHNQVTEMTMFNSDVYISDDRE